MERYICIHGHFYQPPRENPWLESIELQDSAYPYHDWNERITAECYAANAASRILNGEGRIRRIVNNYSRISFNVGPTLLAWLEWAAPDVYRAILRADRESQRRFSGHGSAIAQVYNHLIMPLANRRDKRTQIIWGMRDFERRFGRAPEGMWLAETAVDLETLDLLAEQGIRFTILAPYQAARVRPISGGEWQDVLGGHIDPTRAYLQRLPSGRRIALFFYDGPISRAVAFEYLLANGEHFAHRLASGFNDMRTWPQLVHIATDGESYGHHHRDGDMALAYALEYIEAAGLARLTNYGEYLARFPPTHEVEIVEHTAWSCAHGIERWQSDCGCSSGGYPSWNQAWRAPLRAAFDWLRDTLAPHFDAYGRRFLHDPWAARNDYISVILDRSPESVAPFLRQHALRGLAPAEQIAVLKLMELQRHAQLMYTSCGWFFDELSGIETVQVIQYAGRALQLAQELFAEDFEQPFLERLERAKSNIPEHSDGRRIYTRWVQPMMVGWETIGAHYAISSLFESYPERATIFCYTVERDDLRTFAAGRARLLLGRTRFTSNITSESQVLSFGVLHFGDHNISGGVRAYEGRDSYQLLVSDIEQAFSRTDFPEVIRLLDRCFGESTYSLRSLFRDEQRRCLDQILETTLQEDEAVYRQIYERNVPLMRFLSSLYAPLPRAFHTAAAFVINADLRRELERDEPDAELVQVRLAEARLWNIEIDPIVLGYTFSQTLDRLSDQWRTQPGDLSMLQQIEAAVALARALPFEVSFWKLQNLYYELLYTYYPRVLTGAERGDESAAEWASRFASLGAQLRFGITEIPMSEIPSTANIATIVQEVVSEQRVPRATYRLQFHRGFTFADAQEIIDYLDDLGISDCYASPIFRARADSTHGYDICDHSSINPVIGGEAGFEALSKALNERSIGMLLDVVPNHMGIGDECNAWWMDVLENGPGSIYADYFDIEWNPVKRELADKVLLPILEDQYGRVLEAGKFRLTYQDGAFFVLHYETRLPVTPRTYSRILEYKLAALIDELGEENEHVQELQSILTAISYLPPRGRLSPEKIAERNREKEVIKRRIDALYQASADVRAAIQAAITAFNGVVGDPRSFDMLDDLLSDQSYRPAFWRVAAEEINYRRFFDINDLAAIRMELPEVFEAVHSLIFRLLAEGKVTGLRIDHIDGLYNPTAYLNDLQRHYVLHQTARRLQNSNGSAHDLSDDSVWQAVASAHITAWLARRRDHTEHGWPLYVVAEKILAEREPLPEEWAVSGTTGYDFMNAVNGLFVDGANARAFDRIYTGFVETPIHFRNLVNSTKKMIMLVSLASEIYALSHQLERIAERNRLYRDFTLDTLTFALREVIACLPVYRTYTSDVTTVMSSDQEHVEAAVREAKRRNPRTADALFNFIRDSILLRNINDFRPEDQQHLLHWVMKFQQVTGPVMAKGVEDTAFYVYNRLVSLNEVGGHPDHFGTTLAAFHQHNLDRSVRWPRTMLSSSTHDTKRGEDVRARINVLSEIPEEWRTAINRWVRANASRKTEVEGQPAPDRNDEYLFYQTLIGAWPFAPNPQAPFELLPPLDPGFQEFRDRVAAYMQKATKEAKAHTSWVNPNEAYDAAVQEFVRRTLDPRGRNVFLNEIREFARRVAYYGQFNSLAQTLLKLVAPGVPDIYQGSEWWNFSLVDPDNRRPVDYQRLRAMLAELKGRAAAAGADRRALASGLVQHGYDGCAKLYLVYTALNFRRTHERLFTEGDYLPLDAQGDKHDHVCAFARTLDGSAVVAVVPRLVRRLIGPEERPPLGAPIWGDTWLALPYEQPGMWYRDLFTGAQIAVADHDGVPALPLSSVFSHFPVALIERVVGS